MWRLAGVAVGLPVCGCHLRPVERSRGELRTQREDVRSRTKGMASKEIYKETGRIDLNNDFIFIKL